MGENQGSGNPLHELVLLKRPSPSYYPGFTAGKNREILIHTSLPDQMDKVKVKKMGKALLAI